MTEPSDDPVVVGIDVGGSKTRALLVAGEVLLADREVGSANPMSVGDVGAQAAFDELRSGLATGLGGRTVQAVLAGAAGADTEESQERLRVLLAACFPGARVGVVHDTRIILAAAGLRAGTVVISGTGSVAWGRRADGLEVRAGGWGYLLGDEGSGYGVAREAVREAFAEQDRGDLPGPITVSLLAALELERPWQLLDAFYTRTERRLWARLAGLVFQHAAEGDPVGLRLAEEAAVALATLAGRVNTRLGLRGPVVLAGGQAVHQPLLTDRVAELLREDGIDDVRILDRDPVWGAVPLARELVTTVEESR